MSEFYDEDPNAAWNAGFEADPATTAYALAQAAIAEHEAQNQQGLDEARVAEQAASILAQQQQRLASEQAGADLARTIDRSMTAAYGAQYASLSTEVPNRLAGDPGFQQINHSDPNAVLQFVDGVYQQVANESDPGVAEWSKIKAAGTGSYYEGRS